MKQLPVSQRDVGVATGGAADTTPTGLGNARRSNQLFELGVAKFIWFRKGKKVVQVERKYEKGV